MLRGFAAEEFAFVPKESFKIAREQADDEIKRDSAFEAYASDIDDAVLQIALHNAEKAGVSDRVRVFNRDARDIDSEGRRGTVVCNPPYGERLGTAAQARELYRDIGKSWRRLERWQRYILTSDEEFERFYGTRADKVRRLYNGMIKCGLYQYFRNK